MNVLNELRRAATQAGAVSLVAAAVLAGCGGGTQQLEPFVPGRLITFGDESSVIVNDGANNGLKYSVNGLDANNVRDCTVLPNWVQTMANHYSFVFAECNKAAATPKAFIRARVGAKVDDPTLGMAQQIADQQAAGNGFRPDDLVTVWIGANDIIELSERVEAGAMSENDAIAEAQRRGTHLAERVNTILQAGAKAIVVTAPDMGFTPYAVTKNKTLPNTGTRLSKLSYEFNAMLRTGIDPTRFDGRNYGLVLADDQVQSTVRFPGGYTNVVDGLCAKVLPTCTSATADLVSGAAVSTWMWSDDRHFSPSMHDRMGALALSRALNNPFNPKGN